MPPATRRRARRPTRVFVVCFMARSPALAGLPGDQALEEPPAGAQIDGEPVSPHARGPVFASSVTVQVEGAAAAFDTDRATGKIVASANGELRGCVIGCSA